MRLPIGRGGIWEIRFIRADSTHVGNPPELPVANVRTQRTRAGDVCAWGATVHTSTGATVPGRDITAEAQVGDLQPKGGSAARSPPARTGAGAQASGGEPCSQEVPDTARRTQALNASSMSPPPEARRDAFAAGLQHGRRPAENPGSR